MSDVAYEVRTTVKSVEQLLNGASNITREVDDWGHSYSLPTPKDGDYSFGLWVVDDGMCQIWAELLGADRESYFWNKRLEVEDYDDLSELRSDFLEICESALFHPTRVVRRRQYLILWDFDLIVSSDDQSETIGGSTLVSFGSGLPDNREPVKIYSSPAALSNG